MPRLSILFDRIRWEEKVLEERAGSKGLHVKMVDAKQLKLDSKATPQSLSAALGDVVLQRCISHFRGLHVSEFLESKDLQVVNRSEVARTCGNKLLTTLALEQAGVPTPRSVVAFSADSALEAVDELGYPLVMKPVTGSWGRMVSLVKDRETARALIEMREGMNGPLSQIFYLQELVQRPPRDIRTIAVDGQIVAAVYRNAPTGEWRTNVARGGLTAPCPVTGELEELVSKASRAVGGGVLGIDAMESPRGLLVHEVNGTVEFRGASAASSVDIPGAVVDYLVAVSRK